MWSRACVLFAVSHKMSMKTKSEAETSLVQVQASLVATDRLPAEETRP